MTEASSTVSKPRLAVWASAEATYLYYMAHWRTCLRLIWLPLLIFAAIGVTFDEVARGLGDGRIGLGLLLQGGSAVVGFASLVFVQAILLRHILRSETPQGHLAVRLGADEIRLAVAMGLAVLILVSVYAVGSIGIISLVESLTFIDPLWAQIIGLGILGLMVIGLLWLLVRFSLIGPATIAQERMGLGASWVLTQARPLALFSLLAHCQCPDYIDNHAPRRCSSARRPLA